MRDLPGATRSRDAARARAAAARSATWRVRRRRARTLADLARTRDLRPTTICVRYTPWRAESGSTRALRQPRLAPVGTGTASVGGAARHRPRTSTRAVAAVDVWSPRRVAGIWIRSTSLAGHVLGRLVLPGVVE